MRDYFACVSQPCLPWLDHIQWYLTLLGGRTTVNAILIDAVVACKQDIVTKIHPFGDVGRQPHILQNGMVTVLAGIGPKFLSVVIHAHWVKQQVVWGEAAHQHACSSEQFYVRVFILSIKTPMLDGKVNIIYFFIIDTITP